MIPVDWSREPAHPGDMVHIVALYRGDDIGLVCIQAYDAFVRVGTFLPGVLVEHPGDTPKLEPERCEHFAAEDRVGAEQQFDAYLRDAQDAGWVLPLSTGAECVTTHA